MAERNHELAKDIIDATQGAEFDLGQDAGDQFIVRSVTDGAAAFFINSGQEGYAGAVAPATLASDIHLPHLPVFADHATAQAAASLATGQTYAVTGGAIGVKLA